MAYDRAPRSSIFQSQTGPNVAPNSYEVRIDECCGCRGTNWAPFLSCARRFPISASSETPSPNSYFPKKCDKIIGGTSPSFTAPRFPKFETHKPPRARKKSPQRLKGYMYHCAVPYTLLSYMPSIPKPKHIGYDVLEDKRLVECCNVDHESNAGPEFCFLNYETFGTYYRGSFWSKYSGREVRKDNVTPGVGDYNIVPEPDPNNEFLEKLRHERKKNACTLRYMEQLIETAIRNNYPAPNQYMGGVPKCIKVKKKVVPKKLERPKVEIVRDNDTGPAPNQYYDHRTALYYLVKPTCKEGLSAFLTNAPRFKKPKEEKSPGPNQYHIPTFLEELSRKISPYAIRKTAFDTSVPKKLYYLPPDYPPIPKRKRCRCSEVPAQPEPPTPKPKPIYPFSSKTKRFQPYSESYLASCASYDVQKAFNFAKSSRSFRKNNRYNFLTTEERFRRNGKCPTEGVEGYNLLQYIEGKTNNSGSFTKAKRFHTELETLPGPLDYEIHSDLKANHTFNVTLGGSRPFTNFQIYRMKLKPKPFQGEIVPNKEFKKECETKTSFWGKNSEWVVFPVNTAASQTADSKDSIFVT